MVIELRTLGTLSIELSGVDETRSLTAQGKRTALLVYLVLARPRGLHRRESLLALFWPDSSPERARRALNQAVYVLRRTLGAAVIVTRGDDLLGVAPDAMACDALDFERALAEGDAGAALALYHGTLLDGFDPEGAAGFERWLEEERARYRAAAVDAALRQAAGLEQAGEIVEAVYWTRRACAWNPFDERVLSELLLRLERAGDRAGAVREYQTFAALLEAELGLEPEPETAALLARLLSSEGRANAAVAVPLAGATPTAPAPGPQPLPVRAAPAALPTAAGHTSAAPRRPWRYLVGGALLALVFWASSVARGHLWHRAEPADSASRPRVLVAPLTNESGDSALEPLGRLAADWITQGLARSALVEAVPVAGGVRTAQALTAGVRPDRPASLPVYLARENRAGLLVQGAFFRSGDSLTASVQVRDSVGRVLRAVTGVGLRADEPLHGLRTLREQVIGALATVLDPRLSAWSDAASQPPSFAAYQLYSEGMAAYLRTDWVEAVVRLRRAAGLDSSFTTPLVWALRAHFNGGQYAAADSIARMLELRRDALPPWDRAVYDYFAAELLGDPPGAYHALQRVVEISPGSEWVYHLGVAALYDNRPREAVRLLSSVDPERGWLREWRPYWPMRLEAHHNAGDFAGELAAVSRLEQATGKPAPEARLRALAALRRTEDALRLYGQILDRHGRSWRVSPLAIGFARELEAHGAPEAARVVLREAVAWFEEDPPADHAATHRLHHATVLYLLGRHAEARPLFARSRRERPGWENVGHLGLIAATTGDTAAARACEQWFARAQNPYAYGEDTVWRTGILTLLGDTLGALRVLQQAYQQGLNQTAWLHLHPALVPLRGVVQYEAKMRPAG